MADEQPSLQIDNDWKRQAQEEKKRLADEQQKRQPDKAATPGRAGGGAGKGQRSRRELPPATFTTLVQSLQTQISLYLGEIAFAGNEPMFDLDRAKLQIDLLGTLEEKTNNNLSEDEKLLLDSVLYETRSRFISVASQMI